MTNKDVLQHRSPRYDYHIRRNTGQLDVGTFQYLVNQVNQGRRSANIGAVSMGQIAQFPLPEG